jgi:hypothetical protein
VVEQLFALKELIKLLHKLEVLKELLLDLEELI